MNLEDFESEGEPPLPFRWAALPRRALKPGGYGPLGERSEWTFALATGEPLRLDVLHQYGTYPGTPCDLPPFDEVRAGPVHGVIRLASDMFGVEPASVAVLAPELLASEVCSGAYGAPKVVVAEFLPPVSSIASFRQGDRFGVVAWFQDRFGPPSSPHVMAELAKVDWPRICRDWNPRGWLTP